MSIAYNSEFFNSGDQFSLISTFSKGTLVQLVKDVFMWTGDTVNRGCVKPATCGLNGVVVENSVTEVGFHEHARVQFETGDIGYVPVRWLVAV